MPLWRFPATQGYQMRLKITVYLLGTSSAMRQIEHAGHSVFKEALTNSMHTQFADFQEPADNLIGLLFPLGFVTIKQYQRILYLAGIALSARHHLVQFPLLIVR